MYAHVGMHMWVRDEQLGKVCDVAAILRHERTRRSTDEGACDGAHGSTAHVPAVWTQTSVGGKERVQCGWVCGR